MKTNFTLKGFLFRREGWVSVLILTSFFFFGCYEFFSIKQPTSAYSESTFLVPIVVKSDADGTNDWSVSPMSNYGIFGVLVPDGWVVEDTVHFSIAATDSALATSSSGLWVMADKDHSSVGYFIHSAAYSDSLTAKQGIPPGYHWWGAISHDKMDLAFFDSCSFTLKVATDSKVGSFFMQYTLGDEDYAGRRPVHFASDVLPIEITTNPSSVNDLFAKASFTVYPIPSDGLVTIEFGKYNNQVVDLQVYDISGRNVFSTKLTEAKSTVDLRSLSRGTYFFKMKEGSQTKTLKVLFQ
jgi:hypothetical protein